MATQNQSAAPAVTSVGRHVALSAQARFVFLKGAYSFQLRKRILLRRKTVFLCVSLVTAMSLQAAIFFQRVTVPIRWMHFGFWTLQFGAIVLVGYALWMVLHSIRTSYRYNYFPDPAGLLQCIRNMERATFGSVEDIAVDDDRKQRLASSYDNAANQNLQLNAKRGRGLANASRAVLLCAGLMGLAGSFFGIAHFVQ